MKEIREGELNAATTNIGFYVHMLYRLQKGYIGYREPGQPYHTQPYSIYGSTLYADRHALSAAYGFVVSMIDNEREDIAAFLTRDLDRETLFRKFAQWYKFTYQMYPRELAPYIDPEPEPAQVEPDEPEPPMVACSKCGKTADYFFGVGWVDHTDCEGVK